MSRFLHTSLVLVMACAATSCKSPPKKPDAPAAVAEGQPAPSPNPATFLQKLSPFALLSKLRPHRTQPPVASLPTQIGVIRQVNIASQFVLIDAQMSSAAQAGDTLVVIADRKVTSELKLTALRAGSFLIADILTGEPRADDPVYRK